MNIRAALIIGAAIVIAMAAYIYFSPFQTCKRELESSSDYSKRANAAAYCARIVR